MDLTKSYQARNEPSGHSHDDGYGKSDITSALVDVLDPIVFSNETYNSRLVLSFRKDLTERQRQGGWTCCGNHSIQSALCIQCV